MSTSIQHRTLSHRGQRGAVAIMFGLTVTVLFAMGGVVLDLGHLYIVKAELQNAADAAALAGAKELNQTTAGITNAVTKAQAIGAKNNYNFSTVVNLDGSDSSTAMAFSTSPDGPWLTIAAAKAAPQGLTFMQIDTGGKTLNTYLMRVAGINTINTSGVAVAGRFVNDVTPIGVCAIKNEITGVSRPKAEALPGTNELAQFGFRRGVGYNVFDLGPLGTPSNPYLIDPIDVYPASCNPSNSSANSTAPFICNGSSAVVTSTPGTVYGNTGLSAGKIEAALNSRFNVYGGPSVCIPAQAPPDSNIKAFGCTGGSCATPAADWMAQSNQTITPTGIPTTALTPPIGIISKNNYGVLWSFSKAVRADTSVSPPKVGSTFSTSDWATLYPAVGGAPAVNANYPASTPYADPAHSTAPSGNAGTLQRRVLNMAIVDCPNVTGSGSCQVLPVLGIGRFFMQVPADFGGSTKKLEVEFAGLINPVPTAEIKLYK